MPKEDVRIRAVEPALLGADESGTHQLRNVSLDLADRAAQISSQPLAGWKASAIDASIPGQSCPEELRTAGEAAVGQDHIRHETTGAKLTVWDEYLARNNRRRLDLITGIDLSGLSGYTCGVWKQFRH
jgi:hypothetical protein